MTANDIDILDPVPADDDGEPEDQLTLLDHEVTDLIDPGNFVRLIDLELDELWNQGADKDAINAISSNTVALLESAQKLNASFRASMDIAQKLREQREAARIELAELKTALDEVDLSIPAIEALVEGIEEEAVETAEMFAMEMMWDHYIDRITDETPLTYSEALSLMSRLTDDAGDIDVDHYLWDELKDWMRRCDEYARTGITPPREVDIE